MPTFTFPVKFDTGFIVPINYQGDNCLVFPYGKLCFAIYNQFMVLQHVFSGHANVVNAVAATPNGTLISASADGTIKLWHSDLGLCINTLHGHTDSVTAVTVTPEGTIISGSSDNTIKLWNSDTGECLDTLTAHTDSINTLALTHSGIIVSGSNDNTVKLWNSNSGKCLHTLRGHVDNVNTVAITPSGAIVSGSQDNTIRLWNSNTGKCVRTLITSANAVNSIDITPTGIIISGNADNTISMWNSETGAHLQTLIGHLDAVKAVAVIPNNVLVSAGHGTVILWNTDTSKLLYTIKGHTDRINCLATAPDNTVFSGGNDGTIQLWNSHSGTYYGALIGHLDRINAVVITPDRKIFSASDDGTIRRWNNHTKRCLRRLNDQGNCIQAIAITPNGLVVSGDNHGHVKLWNSDTEKYLCTIEKHADAINSIVITTNGRVFSGSNDGIIKLWNSNTKKHIRTLTGHTSAINTLTLTPNNILASGDNNGIIKLWDGHSHNCFLTLQGHTDAIHTIIAISNHTIVSGSKDNTIKFWNSDTGECVHTLPLRFTPVSLSVVDNDTLIIASAEYVVCFSLSELTTQTLLSEKWLTPGQLNNNLYRQPAKEFYATQSTLNKYQLTPEIWEKILSHRITWFDLLQAILASTTISHEPSPYNALNPSTILSSQWLAEWYSSFPGLRAYIFQLKNYYDGLSRNDKQLLINWLQHTYICNTKHRIVFPPLPIIANDIAPSYDTRLGVTFVPTPDNRFGKTIINMIKTQWQINTLLLANEQQIQLVPTNFWQQPDGKYFIWGINNQGIIYVLSLTKKNFITHTIQLNIPPTISCLKKRDINNVIYSTCGHYVCVLFSPNELCIYKINMLYQHSQKTQQDAQLSLLPVCGNYTLLYVNKKNWVSCWTLADCSTMEIDSATNKAQIIVKPLAGQQTMILPVSIR